MKGLGKAVSGTAMFLFIAVILVGCGGGGGGGSSQGTPPAAPTSAVAWDPPQTYADNTSLDPARELDYYEIYLNNNAAFTEDDQPVALVSAAYDDPLPSGSGTERKLTTEFPLDALVPFAPSGPVCFISVRAVGVDGQRSGFMVPVSWNRT